MDKSFFNPFITALENMKLSNEKVGISTRRNVDENWKFYHVVQRAYRRYHILIGNTAWYYHSLTESKCAKYGVLIVCQVIMSNHIHEILYSEDVMNISRLKQMAGSKVSVFMNKTRLENKKKPLEHLFDSRPGFVPIKNRVQLLITLKYIWDNDLELRKIGEKASYSSFENWKAGNGKEPAVNEVAALYGLKLSELYELLGKDKKEVLAFAEQFKTGEFSEIDKELFQK